MPDAPTGNSQDADFLRLLNGSVGLPRQTSFFEQPIREPTDLFDRPRQAPEAARRGPTNFGERVGAPGLQQVTAERRAGATVAAPAGQLAGLGPKGQTATALEIYKAAGRLADGLPLTAIQDELMQKPAFATAVIFKSEELKGQNKIAQVSLANAKNEPGRATGVATDRTDAALAPVQFSPGFQMSQPAKPVESGNRYIVGPVWNGEYSGTDSTPLVATITPDRRGTEEKTAALRELLNRDYRKSPASNASGIGA